MTGKAEYDGQAAEYDNTRFNDEIGRHLDAMHKKILCELVDSDCSRLLEAGVGTGRFATWLAKKGFEVVGIDLSTEMLRKAKEKKKRMAVDVDLVKADVHSLPFRQDCFDGGICINVMDHFPNTTGFLRQVRYVVKPDGSFVFNFSNAQSLYLPAALLVNSNGRAMFKSGKIYSAWFTFKRIRKLLQENNFDIIAVKGCFVASPVPFGNRLVKVIRAVNLSAEDTHLRFFAGSPFVKVKPLKNRA